MKKAIATPVRVSKNMGLFYFEVTAIKHPDGSMSCGICGTGRTYENAKADFWDQWHEMCPDVYLDFKLSSR